MHTDVVICAQHGAVPTPRPGHVALFLQPRGLEQAHRAELTRELECLVALSIKSGGRVERIGPLGALAVDGQRLAVVLEPPPDLRVSLRPASKPVDLAAWFLQILRTRT